MQRASTQKSTTVHFAVLKPFIPFVTTPTNILKQGLYESTGLDAVGKTLQHCQGQRVQPAQYVQ